MLAFYVTGHGFGHATRAAALARALKEAQPSLDLEIRTEAPEWIFKEQRADLAFSRGGADCGMVQKDAVDLDLEKSLARQMVLDADWPALIAVEKAWLKSRGARLVIGDIAPLAFAAARAAGLPSLAVSNFSWDWIFEPYAEADARWRPSLERCRDAYGAAEAVLRLPLHGEFPAFKNVEDVPLLCRLGRRRDFGQRGRPLVLIAFGGFGLDLARLTAEEDLSAYLFAGFEKKPEGLRADWVTLRSGTSEDQLDAMASCGVVLGKPGYGMISEAFAHGKRMLYLARTGFREIGPLTAGLRERGACAELSRADFEAGRWGRALAGLLAQPSPRPIPAAGAAALASRILARYLLE